jgi:uncharacterized membrane protein YhaH (DUF805 family)
MLKKYLGWTRQFFFSKGKFQPPYFWITLLLLPVVVLLYLKVVEIMVAWIKTDVLAVPLELLSLVFGFVILWLGVYNWNNIRRPRHDVGQSGSGADEPGSVLD